MEKGTLDRKNNGELSEMHPDTKDAVVLENISYQLSALANSIYATWHELEGDNDQIDKLYGEYLILEGIVNELISFLFK